MKFTEMASDEVDRLKKYHGNLSPIQKYFFPKQLKEELSKGSPDTKTAYKALFQANWFLKHWPFFSFLGKFPYSNENPVAQTFLVAHELYGLNDSTCPTQFNNHAKDIEYLQQYKNKLSWFFPKELSFALEKYKTDLDLFSFYGVLANHTNHWFFRKPRVFEYTPLLHIYREIKDKRRVCCFVGVLDKNELFQKIAKSDDPLKQFALTKKVVQCLNRFPINEDPMEKLTTALTWLKQYPKVDIEALIALQENASKETIEAIETIQPSNTNTRDGQIRLREIRLVAGALGKLPKELSNDSKCIYTVANSTHPEEAAIILRYFHKDKLLDSEEDKNICLNCIQQNFPPLYQNDAITFIREDGVYSYLQFNWLRINKSDENTGNLFSIDDKKDIIKYSQHLFNSKTSTLWSAVPDQLLHQLYKEAITICKQCCLHRKYLKHTPEIIALLLNQSAVFNHASVQLDPQYDEYTTSMIDNIAEDVNSDSDSRYNVLSHFIRRNSANANKTILTWLDSDPNLQDKVCNVKPPQKRSDNSGIHPQEITIKDILLCAKAYNPTIHNEIMNRRYESTKTNNSHAFHRPSPNPTESTNEKTSSTLNQSGNSML